MGGGAGAMSKKTQHHLRGKLRMVSVVGLSSTCLLLYVFFFVFYSGKSIVRPDVTESHVTEQNSGPLTSAPEPPPPRIEDPAPVAAKATSNDDDNDGESQAQADMYTDLADNVRIFGDPNKKTFANIFEPHKVEGQKRKGAADKVVVCVVPKGGRYGCKHISSYIESIYFVTLSLSILSVLMRAELIR